MTCGDVRAWLDLEALGLLDDASDAAADAAAARARVREHVAACAACAARSTQVAGARDALTRIDGGPPLPAVAARLGARPPRRAGGSALLAAIAAAVVALAAVTLGRGGPAPDGAPEGVPTLPGSPARPLPRPAPAETGERTFPTDRDAVIFYTTPLAEGVPDAPEEALSEDAPPSPSAPAPAPDVTVPADLLPVGR